MLSKKSRAWNGVWALVNLSILALIARTLWSSADLLPTLMKDAHNNGDYAALGITAFIVLFSIIVGIQLMKDGYQQGYKAFTGNNVAQESIKLEFGTTELDSFLDKFTDQLKQIKQETATHITNINTQPAAAQHPDDEAVDLFATIMKARLAQKRREGRGGWDTDEVTDEELHAKLKAEFSKSYDTRRMDDVANYAAFIWYRDAYGVKSSASDSEEEHRPA